MSGHAEDAACNLRGMERLLRDDHVRRHALGGDRGRGVDAVDVAPLVAPGRRPLTARLRGVQRAAQARRAPGPAITHEVRVDVVELGPAPVDAALDRARASYAPHGLQVVLGRREQVDRGAAARARVEPGVVTALWAPPDAGGAAAGDVAGATQVLAVPEAPAGMAAHFSSITGPGHDAAHAAHWRVRLTDGASRGPRIHAIQDAPPEPGEPVEPAAEP